MEKTQYELCLEVLRRLDEIGVLKHVVLVGSWCTWLYRDYFASQAYAPSLKTRDIDLLLPRPTEIKSRADVADLLRDLGFVVGFAGRGGYIRLEHPQLIIEFLVPERGRPSEKPYPLPNLGLNAQALRFLDFLAQNTIAVRLSQITVTLPHPAHFALHKLLVLRRRPTPEKQTKDKEAALRILGALIDKGEEGLIREAFNPMPQRWKAKVKAELKDPLDRRILVLLEQ
ncbi:MAG: hypothetical protein JW741_01785 [Sedimentisphaerales bacterium]|nr:hypothetical protein [Sedimentisphaerales bacterium]